MKTRRFPNEPYRIKVFAGLPMRVCSIHIEPMPDDPDDVLLDMVINNVRSAPHWDQPVLSASPPPPRILRRAVLGWPPKIQSQALEILHGRHELRHGALLASERSWVTVVKGLLSAALPNQCPMSRERLRSAIARNLASLRPAPDASATAPEPQEQVPMPKRMAGMEWIVPAGAPRPGFANTADST